MNKIILGLLFSLFLLSANADHEDFTGEVYIEQLPSLCGTPESIQKYIDHMKFKPFHLSLGREAMTKEGQPVFMVTYMVNEDSTESIAVLDIPNGLQRCIMFHTFDLITEIPNKG